MQRLWSAIQSTISPPQHQGKVNYDIFISGLSAKKYLIFGDYSCGQEGLNFHGYYATAASTLHIIDFFSDTYTSFL